MNRSSACARSSTTRAKCEFCAMSCATRSRYGPMSAPIGRTRQTEEVTPSLASCLAETLAPDTDGIHPDEVLGFALDPRLEADVGDRRTLSLGVYVMGR